MPDSDPQTPRAVSRRRVSRSGCGVLFFGVFALFGLFFLSFFGQALWQAVTARGWQPVSCTVISSQVVTSSGSDSDTHRVAVSFTYEVDGRSYRSDRYQFMTGSSSGYDRKARIVSRLPPGTVTDCWFDPEQPSSAVMNRGLTGDMAFALIPLLFVAIGAIGMTASLLGWRRDAAGKKEVGRAETVPGMPQSSLASAVGRRLESSGAPAAAIGPGNRLSPESTPRGRLGGILLMTLFWWGILGVFLYQASNEPGGIFRWGLMLFLTPFVLVGLVLIASCVHFALALRNPRVELTLDRPTVRLGESFTVRWQLRGRSSALSELTIQLVGREIATYRRGTDNVTEKEAFAEIDVARVMGGMAASTGGATVTVPTTAMHSFEAPNNEIEWTLEVDGKIERWPDVDETFPLVVEPLEAGGR